MLKELVANRYTLQDIFKGMLFRLKENNCVGFPWQYSG